MKFPKKLDPSTLTALVDNREQHPFNLEPLRTERATLTTGDYSLLGLETVVAIERKSLDDLLACIGRERERFEKEVQRLLAFQLRVLVVEASWRQMELGAWRSRVTPESAIGSLLSWQSRGLSVHMADSHEQAGKHVARLLYHCAKCRYRELLAFAGCVEADEQGEHSFEPSI